MNASASSVLLVGSGALATLFAARLAAAGVEVSMLATWPEGLAALREHGARLEAGPAGRVRACADPADCRGARWAVVLVKAWQTGRAAEQLAGCLAEDGLALTLQNGLGNDAILSGRLGGARVARGVTTLGATLLGPGRVRPGGDGPVTVEAHERLAPLMDILRIAKFNLQVVPDARPAQWAKLVVSAAINPLSALLRVRNGELLASPGRRALLGELAGEAAAVARALGVPLPDAAPERLAAEVAERTAGNFSSMLQDVLRGAPTEVDAINGAVVRAGERGGVSTPLNRAVWALVKALALNDTIA